MYEDGEIVGIDNDGCLEIWDEKLDEEVNCGQTIEEYGPQNIRDHEWARIGGDEEKRKHLS